MKTFASIFITFLFAGLLSCGSSEKKSPNSENMVDNSDSISLKESDEKEEDTPPDYNSSTVIKAVLLRSDGTLTHNIIENAPLNETGIRMIVEVTPNVKGKLGDNIQLIVYEEIEGTNEAKEIYNETQARNGANLLFKVNKEVGCLPLVFKLLYNNVEFKKTTVYCACGE